MRWPRRFAACAMTPARPNASATKRRAGHESDIRQSRRDTGMFAKRDEYVMTEEEIAEYEKTEKEEQEQEKKKKQPQDRY